MTDATAIDFGQLLRQEKKRARQRQRKKGNSSATTTTSPSATTTTATSSEKEVEDSSETTDTAARIPPWPRSLNLPDLQLPRLDRSEHCVCVNPRSVYYLSHFLPSDYGRELLKWLQQLETNEQVENETAAWGRWTTLPHAGRRVALWDGRQGRAFPPPLSQLVEGLVASGVFTDDVRPNHILINEYQTGQGILPHTDGPAYAPQTATLSLGGTDVLLCFTPRAVASASSDDSAHPNTTQVLLEGHGSLVVFEEEAYSEYCHSIAAVAQETTDASCVNAKAGRTLTRSSPRISLTFRHKY